MYPQDLDVAVPMHAYYGCSRLATAFMLTVVRFEIKKTSR